MTELAAQVEQYLLSVGPRYSASSLRAHRVGLQRFQDFAQAQGLQSVADVTDQTLREFASWLVAQRNLAEATVDLRLRCVSLFLAWACRTGLTLSDGGLHGLPKPVHKTPKPPTVAVMKRLLELPDRETPLGLRDQFALELLYSLGLRRLECSVLDLADLDLTEETLRVLGKNSDERLLPVSPRLAQCAQDYLCNARPKLSMDGEQALFIGQRGQRLSDQSFRLIVRKYGDKLGLKLSAHQIRHACATHLVEAGMELAQVQQLLGHRDLCSTKRYAQISQRQLKLELHRCRP